MPENLRWLWVDPGKRNVCTAHSVAPWCCPDSPHKHHHWLRHWPGTQPCQSGICQSGRCSYTLKTKQTVGYFAPQLLLLWSCHHSCLPLTQGYLLLVWFQCASKIIASQVLCFTAGGNIGDLRQNWAWHLDKCPCRSVCLIRSGDHCSTAERSSWIFVTDPNTLFLYILHYSLLWK